MAGGVGTRRSIRSLPTQTILDSMIFQNRNLYHKMVIQSYNQPLLSVNSLKPWKFVLLGKW